MSLGDTTWVRVGTLLGLAACMASPAFAQQGSIGETYRPSWRRIGGTTLEAGLPSAAGGAVSRVWFDGAGVLHTQLANSQAFVEEEVGTWRLDASRQVPPESASLALEPPEPGSRIRITSTGIVYAYGAHLWRSSDGGRTWRNQTLWREQSLLGSAINDFAVHPVEPDRIAVGSATGVWLSNDGGLTWVGRNETLPSLPVRRILAAPGGVSGLTIGVESQGVLEALEWAPTGNRSWVPVQSNLLNGELALRSAASRAIGTAVTSVVSDGSRVWAGDRDGRIWRSFGEDDAAWSSSMLSTTGGPVSRIWGSSDARVLLATLDGGETGRGRRVFRSLDLGRNWDDLTANLPPGAVYGVTADVNTGAIYVATETGIFFTLGNLQAPAPATAWVSIRNGLPMASVRDVFVDPQGLYLFAALDGHGVYLTAAPHRLIAPALVHAADFGMRAAAPGALLTLFGARVTGATANEREVQILAAGDTESQVQVPFELTGDTMRMVLASPSGQHRFGLDLRPASPAILVDREGAPMVIDADSGLQLGADHPARPGMRIQLMATGLGRVDPEWPSGLAAPLQNPPRVRLPIRVKFGGQPVPVVSATLAPGYIGYYLVEADLPAIADAGPAEISIEAAGQESNRVRVYVEQ